LENKYDYITEQYDGNIPVPDAAKIMNKPVMFLYCGLRARLFPFGSAVLMEKQWSYHISPTAFARYMNGDISLSIRDVIAETIEETLKQAARV